jgi:hypothetical protein
MPRFTTNSYAMQGRTDIAHIPPMPLWVAIIRICQFVRTALVEIF